MTGLTLMRRASIGLAATGLALTMGMGPAHAQTLSAGCAWSPGTGGCSFTTQTTGLTQVVVTFAGGPAPLVDEAGPVFCFANTAVGGLCEYGLNAVAGDKVVVKADPATSGVASEADQLP